MALSRICCLTLAAKGATVADPMRRIRDPAVVVLLAVAVVAAAGAGTAHAKKRKTVRVPVTISLFHAAGSSQFTGTITSRFPRCVQFAPVLLTKASATSAAGPFTPPVQVTQVDSGPVGTLQIGASISFVPGYPVQQYAAQTPPRLFKARKKNVVCKAGVSPPVTVYQSADD